MGESCDTHSDEEKVLPEKNKKRRLKTPSQVEALEKFYNEHKYPSESMKSELAEELGLSEKQISGWFCHRRLKDKKLREETCVNGRQDLSSGVIQEYGSGLRQDSCSSTKQGDYRHFDPREVESHRLYGQDYPVTDRTYKTRDPYMHAGHYGAVDNTSSGSSSASQDRLLPLSRDQYDMEHSRFHSRNSNNMPMDTRVVQHRGYMKKPSGYLKLQDDVEHAAIIAVKRQLGRQYLEDGPPLGVEFQPLPPGAFESPVDDLVHEPYYVGDPIQKDSHSIPRTSTAHGTGVRSDRYNSNMHAQGPSPEGSQLRRTMWESDPQDEFPSYPLKQKSSVTNYSSHAPDWNSALDFDEDSAGETSGYNSRRNHVTRSKHGVEGMRSDFTTGQRLRLHSGKGITRESSYPQLHNYDNASPNVFQREYFESKPSNSELLRNESLDNEDRAKPRTAKFPDERAYVDRRMGNEYGNQVHLPLQLKNEIRMARRSKGDECLPRENVSKTPSPQALLPWTNLVKGSAVETPTSFSEDETEETSSSTG